MNRVKVQKHQKKLLLEGKTLKMPGREFGLSKELRDQLKEYEEGYTWYLDLEEGKVVVEHD